MTRHKKEKYIQNGNHGRGFHVAFVKELPRIRFGPGKENFRPVGKAIIK